MVNREDIINQLTASDIKFDHKVINKAVDFAIYYHGKQTRASGDPYYYHPLHVALIAAKMKLDTASVVTALLHDTVEDTELTLIEIEKHFGSEVATLVDGVTKLTKIEFQSHHIRQAENFRKLLLATSHDIRVLLVKLADRLHNMRTINYIKAPNKRIRIAIETIEIYAPLAERIGVQQIKLELQDLAFQVMYPKIRNAIIYKITQYYDSNQEVSVNITSEISSIIAAAGVKARVYGRHKTPYSIWMKMRQKGIGLEQLSDLMAFRIIVSTIQECYQVLGIIHTTYKMVPNNFQDFISIPKNNNYQSIHTVIIGPQQKKIEIQIRTEKMHRISEFGVAAHWQYKQKCHSSNTEQHRWMLELLNILEQSHNSTEFLHDTKLSMYYEQVFCFTPEGRIVSLPKGATVIDFAYKIHSDLGNKCIGAKVNNRVVKINELLHNGDQIEIITSNIQSPTAGWEKFATTGKSRLEIRKFIRNATLQERIALGKETLVRVLLSVGIGDVNTTLAKIARHLQKKSIEDIFLLIADGSLGEENIIRVATATTKLSHEIFYDRCAIINADGNDLVSSAPSPGTPLDFATCCYPLPGDKILGFVNDSRKITIHGTDRISANNLHTIEDNNSPQKESELQWNNSVQMTQYNVPLEIFVINKEDILSYLLNKIETHHFQVNSLKVICKTYNTIKLELETVVSSLDELNTIINTLRSHENIVTVERISNDTWNR